MAASVVHLGCFHPCNLSELVQRTQVQTESRGFYLPYSPEKFSKFRCENTCFVFSKKSSKFQFSLCCSQLVYTCSKYGVVQTLFKTFPKRIFFPFSIHKWHIIVQTNRQNKTSIQIFQSFLTNEAPLVLIFFRGLHITYKTYNLSVKRENYQLD